MTTDDVLVSAVGTTLLVSAGAVLLSLPFGLGLAWVLARRRFRGQALVETLVAAPLVLPAQARDVDRAAWALIQDLKERGLFDETLVIWGGEFGRTIYSQGKLTPTDYGRDHHPRCFSLWMAGGGVKGGVVYGETDDFSYNIVKDPVHIHDLHATMLHLLGIDHTKLTFAFQGRNFRLTDVHGTLVDSVIA